MDVSEQRLIFSGKQLIPDDKRLSDFGISHLSSVHLFPKPIVSGQISTPVPEVITSASLFGDDIPSRHVAMMPHYMATRESLQEAHINASIPEVRIWCYILFFSSFMSLFNNLSFIMSTGKPY